MASTPLSLVATATGTCEKWRVLAPTGAGKPKIVTVTKGQRLGLIRDTEGKEVTEVLSPCDGKILSISIQEGESVVVGQCLGYIVEEAPCEHPVFYAGICCKCGTLQSSVTASKPLVSSSSSSSSSVVKTSASSSLLVSGGHRLTLSNNEASLVEQKKSLALRNARKLALVLDLDHTLIHATGAWNGFETIFGSSGSSTLYGNNDDDPGWNVKCITIDEGVSGFPPKSYLIKLRPHLEWFLTEAHKLCNMTIYTAGTRKYAEAVAKAIDPDDIFFKGRIVSRSDIPNDKSEGLDKSLERIFLSDASMAVIMDDREDVWRGKQADQLLLVRPFHFFVGSPEVNNASGPSSSAIIPSSSSTTAAAAVTTTLVLPSTSMAEGTTAHSISSSTASAELCCEVSSPVQTQLNTQQHAIQSSSLSGPIISLAGNQPGLLISPADAYALRSRKFQDRMSAGLHFPSSSSTAASAGVDTTGTPMGAAGNMPVPVVVNMIAEYDDQLPRCLALLQGIHRNYYDAVDGVDGSSNGGSSSSSAVASTFSPPPIPPSVNVGRIISDMKLSVLCGYTIAFSGLIPVNDASPQHHQCWRLAESLGARVTTDITAETTHLISASATTTKVQECLNRGNVWVLHLDWLYFCRWCLAKADERTFMLVAQVPGKALPNPVCKPIPVCSSSSSISRTNNSVQGSLKRKRQEEEEEEATVEATNSSPQDDDYGYDDDGDRNNNHGDDDDDDDDDDNDDENDDDWDFEERIRQRDS